MSRSTPSSAGSRTLLLFGLVTLLSGAELTGERLVDLYGLKSAELHTTTQLFEAGNYDRVRFDPTQLRFGDAIYYRRDLRSFSEQDPRVSVRVVGATELAALTARRRELHGVHVVVEDVALASPPFWLDDPKVPTALRGEARVDRLYAALAGGGDGLYVAPGFVGDRSAAVAAFTPRTHFEGSIAALAEADGYEELAVTLRSAGRVDPDMVAPFVVLDGVPLPPEGSVLRLVPLGSSYNLFVAAPEGVDLATTPAEGTIDRPIDDVVARKSLRQTIFGVRRQPQEFRPLRIIYPGTAASFRASPTAPWTLHPGGAILLALGVICSVLGIVWGARRDRSGTEEKLWFEAIVGVVELAVVVVPALYFVLHRTDQAPAPPIGGSAPVAIATAAVQPSVAASAVVPGVKEKPEDLANAIAAVAEIKKANTANMLAIDAGNAEVACAKLTTALVMSAEAKQVCVRDRALHEVEAALALLGAKKGDKKALCQLADRASRRLVDAKLHDETDVRDTLAKLGRACL